MFIYFKNTCTCGRKTHVHINKQLNILRCSQQTTDLFPSGNLLSEGNLIN